MPDDQSACAVPPDPELQRLEPLLGTRKIEDHTQESVLRLGVPVTSTETFYWLDGGYFFVSTYETVFGDEPPQKGVNYWGYDSDAKKFRIIFFSNNGPFSEEGNRYQGDSRRQPHLRRPGALPVGTGSRPQDQGEPRPHDLPGLVAS